MDAKRVVACFEHYLGLEGIAITRADAERRMLEKLTRSLTEDVVPLLPLDVRFNEEDALEAFERIWNALVSVIPGEPWKASEKVVAQLREKRYPNLLRESCEQHLRESV